LGHATYYLLDVTFYLPLNLFFVFSTIVVDSFCNFVEIRAYRNTVGCGDETGQTEKNKKLYRYNVTGSGGHVNSPGDKKDEMVGALKPLGLSIFPDPSIHNSRRSEHNNQALLFIMRNHIYATYYFHFDFSSLSPSLSTHA
jgi:hypothetical protein